MNFRSNAYFLFFLSMFALNKTTLSIQNVDDHQKSEISFLNEITICRMYNDSCYTIFTLESGIDIKSLNFKIEDPKYTLVDKILQCDNLTDEINNNEYFSECNKMHKSNKYEIYLIHLSPQLIGYTSLNISTSKDNKKISAKQLLVVKEPRRFIDKVFMVLIWVKGIIISLLMGILLDINTLKKLISMPLPVGIGLTCQYLLMPLVSF